MCSMGSTDHVFQFTCMHACAHKIDDVKALIYALDIYMIVCRCMHACQECTSACQKHICQIWIACILACMQIVDSSIKSTNIFMY